jgi:uncharacterized protein YegJ (DUF2314 family)
MTRVSSSRSGDAIMGNSEAAISPPRLLAFTRNHGLLSAHLSRAKLNMGKYKNGDHVKIEVEGKQFAVGEWMWMLVEDSDDEKRLVFGRLDNEPIANPDFKLGQQLAVSYDKIRDHQRFGTASC